MQIAELTALLHQAFRRIDRLEEIIEVLCPHTDLSNIGNDETCSLCGKLLNRTEPDEPPNHW